jgi:hypothetical protein
MLLSSGVLTIVISDTYNIDGVVPNRASTYQDLGIIVCIRPTIPFY